MGCFATLYSNEDSKIPESKKQEFQERIQKLFQAGGMMEVEPVTLLGKKLAVLRKVTMKEDGMSFHYNYFEEDVWENAGFSIARNSVWSNKIGGLAFHRAIVSAYVLQELYTDGIAATISGGELVTDWGYVGWINYLFNEKFLIKNFDTWELYENTHDKEYLWEDGVSFGRELLAFISTCEINAVRNGTKKAIEMAERMNVSKIEKLLLELMIKASKEIEKFSVENNSDEKEQVDTLMEAIKNFYSQEERNSLDIPESKILRFINILDSPVFLVKCSAEIYSMDFWALWGRIKHIAKRKVPEHLSANGCYIEPISTEKWFHVSSDDLILYWEEDGKITFSTELENWFKTLHNRFKEILTEELNIKNPLSYILNLMEEASDNYFRIYTQAEFFEESLENLNNRKFQALWKLYEEMIHDPICVKAGDVIFVPNEPGHENEGLHYWGEQPKRRLISNWEFMNPEMKQNKGRVTLRRYMALVANKALRRKVFGF